MTGDGELLSKIENRFNGELLRLLRTNQVFVCTVHVITCVVLNVTLSYNATYLCIMYYASLNMDIP